MKIRNGFVSNSSSSSFVLMYIPPSFDFDSHLEYMLEKYKNKEHEDFGRPDEIKEVLRHFKKDEIENFIKKGRRGRMDVYDLSFFLEDYVVFETTLEYEGYDTIKLIDKRMFDKFTKMDSLSNENILKYKDVADSKNRKREFLKDKMKGHDPYGEEEWDEDLDNIEDPLSFLNVESHKIKKFDEL